MRTSIHKLKWGLFNLIEGDFIGQYARTYGEWSEVEVQFFLSRLSETDNVIEVGSNIGMHAVPIAQKISQGKLFCFEPQRVIFQNLCCNLSLNQLTNVYTYNEGVGAQENYIEIATSNYETAWNYGSFSLDKGFNTEGEFGGVIDKQVIRVNSLDRHPEIQKLNSLALLKIDAEGFELNVLDGAKETIGRHKPIIFLEAHPDKAAGLVNYLSELDYRCYWFISDRYQPNNYFRQEKSISGLDFNLACFPRTSEDGLADELRADSHFSLENIPLVTYS
ncbi:FkbM family methyltransferase [Caviibacterium pharyngocola]|uniref:Methyltransferase FkbM domain-containing protein n=1 Tax=Caviibacterium pharyngocola TaxID=28159 RepID=A0A2M8RWG3_9PAST|nr:FkbM family methyltransferase [Caviibacterium pharyngocola]PJG83211.1 hypothetical protein CVP04_05375 [Caviibacterium pharyngocola]